jgi:hypothetical protein
MKSIYRKTSFWNNELPLTSKRAHYILSRPGEAKVLANAIRAARNPGSKPEDRIIKFITKDIASKIINMK